MALLDQMTDMIAKAARQGATQARRVTANDDRGGGSGAGASAGGRAGAGAGSGARLGGVDIEATLAAKAEEKGGKSNWRSSIADLMRLLDLDPSLDNRKELAGELGYTGALDGSAEMNIWLHRQVMTRLAAHGGTVPNELKG